MEKSPSPVYGARLELVYGLIAHRGFESLLLRQTNKNHRKYGGFLLYTRFLHDCSHILNKISRQGLIPVGCLTVYFIFFVISSLSFLMKFTPAIPFS